MPLYEYVCRKCEHQFEALVSGDRAAACPKCESTKLEQMFSSFAVGVTKGRGRFNKSSASDGCGSCGDPRGPGSCSSH